MPEGRYILEIVYHDGVPRILRRSDDLASLLRRRDEKWRAQQARVVPHYLVFVTDDDDPERGALDWDAEELGGDEAA